MNKQKILILAATAGLVLVGAISAVLIQVSQPDPKRNDIIKAEPPLKLNQYFDDSALVVVGRYQKEDLVEYDTLGLYNYQLAFEPVAVLKGQINDPLLYIHVHSPSMQLIGHEENFGKLFIIFCNEDSNNDRHYCESIDFIKAFKLD